MTFLAAVAVFPLLLAALCVGAGLLADRLAGGWVPGALLPVLGLATLVGVTQLVMYPAATAPAAPWVVVAVAVAGGWFGRARLRTLLAALRATPWPALATVAAYLVALAPVLLAGRPSLTLYLVDTTEGTHLLGVDFFLHHGRDFAQAGNGTSSAEYLQLFFGRHYPAGGHTLLAATGALLPIPFLWEYQPFMAFLLATSAGPMWLLLTRLGARGWWAGAGAFVASVPALVLSFDQVGSIKELVALPCILALGVLVVEHRRWLAGAARAAVPLALLCAAGLSAVGVSFAAWTIVTAGVLVVTAVALWREAPGTAAPWRGLLGQVALAVPVGAVAALPTVVALGDALGVASGIATTSDPGNLLRPLQVRQLAGVWLHGDYRTAPIGRSAKATDVLTVVVFLSAAAGVFGMVRRRMWALTLWVAGLVVLWAVLTRAGTEWTDAKLLLLTSPVVALTAWGGVAYLAQGRAWAAAVAGGLIAVGVLGSAAVQYHEANLAPTARYDELLRLGRDFAGKGPALATEFDELGNYALRQVGVSAPGLAYPVGLPSAGYGHSVDLDALTPAQIEQFPLIVMRRSPFVSRPPSDYRLIRRGTYYDVWQRDATAPRVVEHLAAGDASTAAVAEVPCADIRRLARRAQAEGGSLAAATRPAVVAVDAAAGAHSRGWFDLNGALRLGTPGELTTTVDVPEAGPWELWLDAQTARPLAVDVDGRKVGSAASSTGPPGNTQRPIDVTLAAGRHTVRIVRPGGSLAPGDAAAEELTRVGLARDGAADGGTLVRLAPRDYRKLCGTPVDWVERTAGTVAG